MAVTIRYKPSREVPPLPSQEVPPLPSQNVRNVTLSVSRIAPPETRVVIEFPKATTAQNETLPLTYKSNHLNDEVRALITRLRQEGPHHRSILFHVKRAFPDPYRDTYDRWRNKIKKAWNGIPVEEDFKSFPDFLCAVGFLLHRDHQLDRIDTSRGYSLHNCRWLTRSENQSRRGKREEARRLEREQGISRATAYRRLKKLPLHSSANLPPPSESGHSLSAKVIHNWNQTLNQHYPDFIIPKKIHKSDIGKMTHLLETYGVEYAPIIGEIPAVWGLMEIPYKEATGFPLGNMPRLAAIFRDPQTILTLAKGHHADKGRQRQEESKRNQAAAQRKAEYEIARAQLLEVTGGEETPEVQRLEQDYRFQGLCGNTFSPEKYITEYYERIAVKPEYLNLKEAIGQRMDGASWVMSRLEDAYRQRNLSPFKRDFPKLCLPHSKWEELQREEAERVAKKEEDHRAWVLEARSKQKAYFQKNILPTLNEAHQL